MSVLADFDPSKIDDDGVREAVVRLVNLGEELVAEDRALREENQRLREEINRVKGEQGKPKRPAPSASQDHSSEQERRQRQAWHKGSKQHSIEVNREELLTVDPALLPPDAERKGYEYEVVQDIGKRRGSASRRTPWRTCQELGWRCGYRRPSLHCHDTRSGRGKPLACCWKRDCLGRDPSNGGGWRKRPRWQPTAPRQGGRRPLGVR